MLPFAEKAISFDLSGYSSLTKSEIEQHISILNFETTLQYLEIPKISPTEQRVLPKARNSRAQVAFQDGEGRTDVPVVFQQLRQKGVETILEVTIDDLEHPAHSDWAIEKALRFDNSTRDMNIEAWNWKKVDICPDLVFSVASGATSIQLYWSGGNAVLRAWSEAEGLPKLTKLRYVVLHVQKVSCHFMLRCLYLDAVITAPLCVLWKTLGLSILPFSWASVFISKENTMDDQFLRRTI